MSVLFPVYSDYCEEHKHKEQQGLSLMVHGKQILSHGGMLIIVPGWMVGCEKILTMRLLPMLPHLEHNIHSQVTVPMELLQVTSEHTEIMLLRISQLPLTLDTTSLVGQDVLQV